MVLAIVGVVIQAGTLNLQGIVTAQYDGADLRHRLASATRSSSRSSSGS